MNINQNSLIPEVLHITPEIYKDYRGLFYENYQYSRYFMAGINAQFQQDNIVVSKATTLRGMHYQDIYPQGKIVTVINGDIFDVAMDIRPKSRTFGVSVAYHMFPHEQIWIPPGFAHGYFAFENDTIITYKVTSPYYPAYERSILWSSIPDITWPTTYPILSEKDSKAPTWQEVSSQLTRPRA